MRWPRFSLCRCVSVVSLMINCCSLLVCRNLVRDVTHAALEGMLVKCVAQKHRWVLSLKLQLVLVM